MRISIECDCCHVNVRTLFPLLLMSLPGFSLFGHECFSRSTQDMESWLLVVESRRSDDGCVATSVFLVLLGKRITYFEK